jgi:hypothetical protein
VWRDGEVIVVTPEERQKWTRIRDEWDEAVIARAKKKGRLPVVDCTLKSYPVPPDVLRELERLERPEVREAAFRRAAQSRRKAASLRSLAELLAGKGSESKGSLAKAEALEREAGEVERLYRAA